MKKIKQLGLMYFAFIIVIWGIYLAIGIGFLIIFMANIQAILMSSILATLLTLAFIAIQQFMLGSECVKQYK
ncbi:hypothetical protein LNP18_05905 [Leuconostoc citreum]|uniref:hypothetical protein n=1 Tax=Leuconostoc citreum TaxID=33964 RepID=UPI00200AD81F|nr:hypothetical protein [Leuconostoc citreum]MCK8605635.1 hypothetical protein [Leuconostoc citreum]